MPTKISGTFKHKIQLNWQNKLHKITENMKKKTTNQLNIYKFSTLTIAWNEQNFVGYIIFDGWVFLQRSIDGTEKFHLSIKFRTH